MDLVAHAHRRPAAGETMLGTSLEQHSGGKGANQAVAAARMGARTSMVGSVGRDQFGDSLVASLQENGVESSHIRRHSGASSGVAIITVDAQAENSIMVIPGANSLLSPADVAASEDLIASAKVMLLQLEIPVETVLCAARLGRKHGLTVILDPAPVPPAPLPAELLSLCDLITPNETEAGALVGFAVNPQDPRPVAEAIQKAGVRQVLIKLAGEGAYLLAGSEEHRIPGFQVQAVDTTAAGDAFAGGLAAAIVAEKPFPTAVRWGCAAGAIAVTRTGAQEAMGTKEEVLGLIHQ